MSMQKRLLLLFALLSLATACDGGCWQSKTVDPVEPAPVAFTPTQTCRVQAGELDCWGRDDGSAADLAGNVVQVDSAAGAICVLRVDGRVHCTDTSADRTEPPTDVEFTEFSVSRDWGCGIRTDGTLRCWGVFYDDSGELADEVSRGGSFRPPPSGPFVQLDTGRQHGCALRPNGRLECWGRKWHGLTDPPTERFVQVVSGRFHSCALAPGGEIQCWGLGTSRGDDEKLHGGETASTDSEEQPVMRERQRDFDQALPPQGRFLQLTAGPLHTCALGRKQFVHCWGRNLDFESAPPSGRFESVAAGTKSTCGKRKEGPWICWGDNSDTRSTPPEGQFWYHVGPPIEGEDWSLPWSAAAQPSGDAARIRLTPDRIQVEGAEVDDLESAIETLRNEAEGGAPKVAVTAGQCLGFERVANVLLTLRDQGLDEIAVTARRPASNRVGVVPVRLAPAEVDSSKPAPLLEVGASQWRWRSRGADDSNAPPEWVPTDAIERSSSSPSFDAVCGSIRKGNLRTGGEKLHSALESFDSKRLREQIANLPEPQQERGLYLEPSEDVPWAIAVKAIELGGDSAASRVLVVP